MTTYTASSFLQQPKQVHVGTVTRHFTFHGAAGVGTSGDVVLLCKIPNRATVIDAWGRYSSGATEAVVAMCVTKGNTASATSTLGTIETITATAAQVRFDFRDTTAFAPFQVSLSDDDAVQYASLKLVFSSGASTTTSISLDGVIVWAMDAEA